LKREGKKGKVKLGAKSGRAKMVVRSRTAKVATKNGKAESINGNQDNTLEVGARSEKAE